MTRDPSANDKPTGAAVEQRSRDRLLAIWKLVESRRATRYTSLVVPSLSFDVDELAKIRGISFYEERLLFTLIRLRDPRARVIYVTSQPIHPEIIDYYLDLLQGVSTRDARSRLKLLALYDPSPIPLTQKILERPRVVQRLRELLRETEYSYLTCFNSSPFEERLAAELRVPLNGAAPKHLWLGTKSGSRKVFRMAGLDLPQGSEDLFSRQAVAEALVELAAQRPGLRRAVIKLNESFAGAGNAIFRYPETPSGDVDAELIERALDEMEWTAENESASSYFGKFETMGGIVEEFVEADEVVSPSTQLRISPAGEVELISTHDQILGGPTGQTYLGCRFPAAASYRRELGEYGMRVGEVLRDHGVVSRFAVDFVADRRGSGDWRLAPIEINLRMGGTTGPFLALQFLTGGRLDAETGLYRSARGAERYYVATDNLRSPAYRGLLPEDFSDIIAAGAVDFDPVSETGSVFHMIGALSQFGKLGVTSIGDSPEAAESIYLQAVRTLDRAGDDLQNPGRRSVHPFDIAIPTLE